MAKRLIKVTVCDRCPVNKQRPATHPNVRFGFGENRWKIALCDQHYDMLSRDLYAWGLLGEEVEETNKPTFRQTPELRRLAELRTRQSQEDREIARAGRDYSVVAVGSQLVERLGGVDVPHWHKDWYFTQHALDRMEEREVDVIEVLRTCVDPQKSRTAREPGLVIHERGETKVVLNPRTKVIITVALRNSDTNADTNDDNRKAVGL